MSRKLRDMEVFLDKLGDEIEDISQETFELFSHSAPLQTLGMVDPKTQTLEVSIAGRDFSITQSPGILQSTRAGGTTGAAVWRTSILLSAWLEWPKNPLLTYGIIHADSTVLELGSGISGLIPCILSSKARNVIATDQSYVLKALRENISANTTLARPIRSRGRDRSGGHRPQGGSSNIEIMALDWETDDARSLLSSHRLDRGIDCVIACDCLYNYALIKPFVQTCADVVGLGDQSNDGQQNRQAVVVIAQQLRQAEVFEQWLEEFNRLFRVWRIPDEMLSEEMKQDSGFVIHVGVQRIGSVVR